MALIQLHCPECDGESLGTHEKVDAVYGIEGYDPDDGEFEWNGDNDDDEAETVIAADGSRELQCRSCASVFSLTEALDYLAKRERTIEKAS